MDRAMRYISTRGQTDPIGFRDAVMMGLATDGGLLLPERLPNVSAELDAWARLSYPELACRVMAPFADLPPAELDELVRRACGAFRTPEVTPVVPVGPVHMLELFHGPTLAFKDVALQFLGNLFERIVSGASSGELNIVGATSGDTGSAAIHGVRGRDRMRIFIMHPRGRISPVQELQMTSVTDANVHNLAIEGTFDDCQAILKALFGDLAFKRDMALGAINSINWARVLAQVVYYFYAGLQVMRRTGAGAVGFSVPTGNFGDIFAGYLAARMGLPVARLVLATNENDILARFFRDGDYSVGPVTTSISPSMDIQVASNFERYLYYRNGEDAERVAALMAEFGRSGALRAEPGADGRIDPLIEAGAAGTERTLATIRDFDARHGYLLDPHSAVGVSVGLEHLREDEPMICLATAHPAKFGAAVRRAVGRDAAHHPLIDALAGLPTRCERLPASADAVKAFIAAKAARA
jgi:threonine synthase